ncbi:MAG: hypothetical protein LWX83_01310 [Anaerolineae bacterium]|nr:hypothetical protein [Anaerolineae bacterium]
MTGLNQKINRREFLIKTGAVLGAAGLLATGAGAWALSEPVLDLSDKHYGNEVNMQKILVAYASKCGSTAEIAERVGLVLGKNAYNVTVSAVQQVKDIGPYQHVILGTALRFEKPLDEMMNFVKRFHSDLQRPEVICFSAGTYMRHDTPENRKKTYKFMQPLLDELSKPVMLEMFGGKVDYGKLSPFWRLLVSLDKSGLMAEGDGRNWPSIDAWAKELAGKLALV